MEVHDYPDVVTEKREDIFLASSVPEVMAGSFCRDQEIVKIIEVKPDESAFYIRLKDGTEDWVDNAELDETTKEFFKLSKPVKVALNLDSRRKEDIKIHHIGTNIIHKISTYGISSIEDLKMRYISNTKNVLSVDLYIKNDTGNLVPLSPATILPIKTTKLFARDVVLSDRASSPNKSTQYWSLGHRFQPMEEQNFEDGEHYPYQDMHEVQRESDDLKIEHRGVSYVPDVEKLQLNVTDSVCSKMSLQQRTEMAMKISNGTLTYGELYETIRATETHGLDARFKTMIASLVGSSKPEWEDKALELIENTDSWLGNNKTNEAVINTRGLSLQSFDEGKIERKRLTSNSDQEESFDDIPNLHQSSSEDMATQSVIIISQPKISNTCPSLHEWLTTLSKKLVADILEDVALKIEEIHEKYNLKIAEIENNNKALVDELKAVIRKQASERNDLSEMMKQNKQSLLIAIDATLTEVNKKFEQRYESFFQQRQVKINSDHNKLERVQTVRQKDFVKAGQGAVLKKCGWVELKDPNLERSQPPVNIPVLPINGCNGKHTIKRKDCDEIDVCDLCEAKVDDDVFSCQRCDFAICGQCYRDVKGKSDPLAAPVVGRKIDSDKQVRAWGLPKESSKWAICKQVACYDLSALDGEDGAELFLTMLGRKNPSLSLSVGTTSEEIWDGRPIAFRDRVKEEKVLTVKKLLPPNFSQERVLTALEKHKWNLQETVNDLLATSTEPAAQNTFYYC